MTGVDWLRMTDSLEQSEVISLSDDSDVSPSVHHDDVHEDEVAGVEVQAGGSEVVKREDQHGRDEASTGATQHGGAGVISADQNGDDLVTDEAQDEVSAAVICEVRDVGDELAVNKDDEQDTHCKPVSRRASDDRDTSVGVQRQCGNETPEKVSTPEESHVTLIPTVSYRRAGRARRGWSHRSVADRAGARCHDDEHVRGAGRGGRARRRAGSRGVPPLSLRQFYDSGGRDYVEYLLQHIQTGTGASLKHFIPVISFRTHRRRRTCRRELL